MYKNNQIRFLNSLILLPFMATTITLGNLPKANQTEISPVAFAQKQNIEAKGLFALNQAEDTKAKTLKLQGEAIDAYFKARNMPLEGLGLKFAEEADKNGLDWRLVAAISVMESSGGKNDCNKVSHSFLGWGSCKINFNSDEEAIETVSRNLGGNNPKTASHYAGKTSEEILHKYNPDSIRPHYADKVMKIMDSMGEADTAIVSTPEKKAEV